MRIAILLLGLLAIAAAPARSGRARPPAPAAAALQERADRFLTMVNEGYKALGTVSARAQWKASTDVKPEHDAAAEAANQAYAAFNGNPALIREARELLEQRARLKPVTVRQLERALLNAAEGPMTNPDLVARRIAAEVRQASTLNGFTFKLGARPVSANEIDEMLRTSRSLTHRRQVWETSKQTGPALKPGLIELVGLRNACARELGYPNYFALQAASYGMSAEEIVALQERFMAELRPLYDQLHLWVRRELARRHRQPVPEQIPAHWLNNRWSQEWTGIVQAASLDDRFRGRSPEWVVKTAEQFYTGLGFPKLPATFWERSDLYPLPATAARKKNSHASCWHVDLEDDIRSLMSVESDPYWFSTAHHELGHGYYFMSYTRPEVPPLLRTGANPAFHEGMGELISLAAGQVPYLKEVGLLRADEQPDSIAFLLEEALTSGLPFLFWASGTMTHWEYDVYAKDLPPEQWNARWWEHVRRYQGVVPPTPRGEEFCDAATKTHINDNPCYYYSYAIATVFKFQLHDHIARKILGQSPRACNYANRKDVGDFLRGIMAKGGTEDWRQVLRDATGEDLSTRAMADYFRPLLAWLEERNAIPPGR